MSRKAIFGKCMIIVVMAILFTQIAYAIGIGPGRTTIDFAPELEKQISFTVYNNEHKEMKALISIEGELAEYVFIQKLLLEFKADETKKDLTYKIELPKKLNKPGEHVANIIVTELPPELEAEGTSIGATTAVITQLLVKVPYKGKYAEARLDVNEPSVGEIAQFVAPVYNGGEEKIESASMSVEISDLNNNIVATIKSKEISLEPKERKELIATWRADVEPGIYKAVALINYDGEVLSTEKEFAVGGLEVDIRYVDVKNFNLGSVAKFNILVENKWNQDIDDLYAQLVITNTNGEVLSDSKSATVKITPQQEMILNTFWDTEGIETGSYSAKVILHYAGKSTERLMNTEVTLNEIKNNFIGTPTGQAIGLDEGELKKSSLLTIVIAILIAINLGWYIYFKRLRRKLPF